MRNLTPEEEKKLMEELEDSIQDAFKNGVSFSTSSVIPQHVPAFPFFNISPTDVDAKGRFEYQEPEQDEQGTFYGYKVLYWQNNELVSPRYPIIWNGDGTCRSDREPSEHHMHGLHFTKRENHPELKNYMFEWMGASFPNRNALLFKCALSGTVVMTEQGFRAQQARIIGVKIDGNWTSYQDFQERARSYSRRVAEEKSQWYADYKPIDISKTGKWYTFDIDPFDPNP